MVRPWPESHGNSRGHALLLSGRRYGIFSGTAGGSTPQWHPGRSPAGSGGFQQLHPRQDPAGDVRRYRVHMQGPPRPGSIDGMSLQHVGAVEGRKHNQAKGFKKFPQLQSSQVPVKSPVDLAGGGGRDDDDTVVLNWLGKLKSCSKFLSDWACCFCLRSCSFYHSFSRDKVRQNLAIIKRKEWLACSIF